MDDLSEIILEPEEELGNHEYKCKLTDLTDDRMLRLTSQMKFRLEEGLGEAIYEIGIRDDGFPIGLSDAKMTESLENLRQIAEAISAKICHVHRRFLSEEHKQRIPKTITKTVRTKDGTMEHTSTFNKNEINDEADQLEIAEVLIREDNKTSGYIDIRIAVAGSVDTTKSSTIGVLTSGILDNGRGSARLNVFNYKHEIATGRTSSISQQIMGYDNEGRIVNERYKIKRPTWQEIVNQSSKIITFFDLAGHERYLKTTIRGMSSNYPDYCMLMVGANMGITHITKEHMILCLTMKIPFFIIMSKIDIAPKHILESTYEKICHLLKLPGVRKIPFSIRNIDDVLLCAKNIGCENIVPIFQISNVTGENLDLIRVFLNCLPSRKDVTTLRSDKVRYYITDNFTVIGVGTVVSGFLTHGTVKIGDKLLIGPTKDNQFTEVQIRSIHCKRVPVTEASAGRSVCFALKKFPRKDLRTGMVLIDPRLEPTLIWEFEAEIMILQSHSTTIRPGYQPVIHIGNIRQAASIISILEVIQSKRSNATTIQPQRTNSDTTSIPITTTTLKTGDRARVRFRFSYHAEWFENEKRLIFRDGKTKGVGLVTKIL
jgi:GTPase